MTEVLAALEAFKAGKLVAVAEPEVGPEAARRRAAGVSGGGLLDSGLRRNDGFGRDGNDGGGGVGHASHSTEAPCGGLLDSGLRRNDGYVDGERAHDGLTGAGPSSGTLDSGPRSSRGQALRRNDVYVDGERADIAFAGAGSGRGAMDSRFRGNDEYLYGERPDSTFAGAGLGGGTLDSGLRSGQGERTDELAPPRCFPLTHPNGGSPQLNEQGIAARAPTPRARPPPAEPAAETNGDADARAIRYDIETMCGERSRGNSTRRE